MLEFPLRNPMRCNSALKCDAPGLFVNLASLFTSKEISGLVQHDKYSKAPITDQ